MSATNTPLIGILMLLFTVSAVAAAALAFVLFKLQRRPIGPLAFTVTLGLVSEAQAVSNDPPPGPHSVEPL